MDTTMQEEVNECTSDDDGNPVCNNWTIMNEVIDGVMVTYLEPCDECTREMGDIHNEEVEEENNKELVDEREVLMRDNAEAAERSSTSTSEGKTF